jgi:predicted nucleotidyltransferase
MWFFKSEKQRKLDSTIGSIVYYIVQEYGNKGLISLYLAGSAIDEKERNDESDIDIFAVVKDDFDFTLEDKLNKKMIEYTSSICNGYKTVFRAFTIGSLKGLNYEGRAIKTFKPERVVQKFRYYRFLWGEKLDFSKGFLQPMKLEDEAYFLMEQINDDINALKRGVEKFPIKDFPKSIIELAGVEAELFYGFKYRPGRLALQNFMKRYNNHIIHKAVSLRNGFCSRNEVVDFCGDAQKYLEELKRRMEGQPSATSQDA